MKINYSIKKKRLVTVENLQVGAKVRVTSSFISARSTYLKRKNDTAVITDLSSWTHIDLVNIKWKSDDSIDCAYIGRVNNNKTKFELEYV